MNTNIWKLAGASTLAIALALPALAEETKDTEKDEIIVTATPLAKSANEALVGVSVMNQDDIASRMAPSLGEVLKNEPGVSSTFFGPAASRPIIRGQGGSRIRVLDNGIGAIDASSASPDHAVSVGPAMAEKVEIIRGSGLLRYGSSGSGGVINVIDGRIPDRVPSQPVEASGNAGYSSVDNGTEFSAGVNLAPELDTEVIPVIHAEVAVRSEGNYAITGHSQSADFRAANPGESNVDSVDYKANSGGSSKSGSVGFGLVGDRGHIGFAVKTLHDEYGIPGENTPEAADPAVLGHNYSITDGAHIDLNQVRYDTNASYDFDSSIISKVNFYGGVAQYKHQEIEDTGEAGTIFRNKGWEARLEALHNQGGDYSAAYGVQGLRKDFSAQGEEAFVPETITHQYGFYTFQQSERGQWHLEGAARYEYTEHKQADNNISRDFGGVSVSAGVDYHVSENLKVGGTLFRTERSPTTAELFANGPHLATAQYEVGDPGLGMETALGGELAIRYDDGSRTARLNVYRTNYDNYIFGERNGNIKDGVPVYVFSGQDAVFQGFEFEGSQDLGQWNGIDWRATGQASYVDAQLTSIDQGLPRIPPVTALVGLDADTGPVTARAEVFWAGHVDPVSANETHTDSYTLVNGSIAWRLLPQKDEVTLRLGVNNLFNVEARQNTSFLKDITPLPGRNIRFSLEMKY